MPSPSRRAVPSVVSQTVPVPQGTLSNNSATIPRIAIKGRSDRDCLRPDWLKGVVHDWTWENLRRLIAGAGANAA